MIIPSRFAEILSSLGERGEVRRAGGEWRTRCPAHDDDGPSLYIGLSPDQRVILLNCKAGCDFRDIVSALGRSENTLFLDDDTQVEVDGDYAVLDQTPEIADAHRRSGVIATAIEAGSDPAAGTILDVGGAVVAHAGADLCHAVHEQLLTSLPLIPTHRQDLHRRGLDDDQIDRLGYGSLKRFALNQAVGRLREQFEEATLLGVPGFRRSRDRVRFVDREGLLVPVRDLHGRIVALKLRREDGEGPKYVWISSSDADGPSPGSPPHVPLGTPREAPVARITEGELKADVSWIRSGLPTVGVPGVSSWKPALPILRAMGVRAVHLAFDADSRTKSGVARELTNCVEGLTDDGFEVVLEQWDPEDGKGIDDLLVAGKRPEVITGTAVGPTIAGIVAAASRSAEMPAVAGVMPAVAGVVASASGSAEIPAVTEVVTSASLSGDDEDWVPEDPADDIAPFPVDCLPRRLGRFISEGAESLQCPADFLGMAMIEVAGGAIGGSRRVRIRRGYEEGPRIYAAIVARPGDGKSPALRTIGKPVYDLQNRRAEQHRRDKARYEEDVEAYEASGRSRHRNDDQPFDVPEKPTRPALAHVFVENATVESVVPILARTPRGVNMFRDELTSWVLGLNQYRGGRGADRQFYLSAWSGEPFKVDRKSDREESLIVADPFLCVIGCIPPAMLAELDASNDGEDGFVHRILFVFPRPVKQRRWSWKGLSPETLQIWSEVVERLYALEFGTDEHGGPTPLVLDLAPEAMPRWESWFNRHAEELESPDFPDVLVGPWSKLVAYAARLALIVHLLRVACGEAAGEEVDAESLERSFRLIAYFKSHARVVYSRLRQPPKVKEVQKAIAWIRRHGGQCTPTDLAKNNVAGVLKKTEAEALMKELEDRGYGRLETRTAGNHRKVGWFIAKPG